VSHLEQDDESIDRRALMKVAAGGLLAGGMLAAAPRISGGVEAADVPNNFRAVVHITHQENFPYAFSTLEIIAKNYKKATGRLILDGDAVKGLTDDDILGQIKTASDAGAEIYAASDALSINGIDPSSLPKYVNSSDPGVIAVVDAQLKKYHYLAL